MLSTFAKQDHYQCLARADDFVNSHESAETAHRSRTWTKQPPTEKQCAYLPAHAAGVTRYEASCHLALRFNAQRIARALAWPEREVA